jgi:hypothetical protein
MLGPLAMRSPLPIVLLALACTQCVQPGDGSSSCMDGPATISIDNFRPTDGRWSASLEDGWFAGADGARQACPRTLYGIECTVPVQGFYTFGARAGDRELSAQSEVALDQFCNAGPRVILHDPCEPEKVEIIRGSLMWRDGEPVTEEDDVDVRMEATDRNAKFLRRCEREGARFRCFAVNDTATDYTVSARLGLSTLLQRVTVPIAQCRVPQPVEIDFVRESWPCAEPRAMPLELALLIPDSTAPNGRRAVLPDTVRLRDAQGREHPCTLAPTTVPNETNVFCPLDVRPRNGIYWVDVRIGTRTETVETYVSDDGCNGGKSWITLWLQEGKTCEGFGGQWCSAPGSVFPSSTRCFDYGERGPRLPACTRPQPLPSQ